MKLVKPGLLLAASVAPVDCGSSSPTVQYSVAGRWAGSCSLFRVQLDLAEKGDKYYRDVTGSGSFVDPTGTTGTFTVSGFNEAAEPGVQASVLLNFFCNPNCPAYAYGQSYGQFLGNWSGQDTIDGSFGPPPGRVGPVCQLTLHHA